VADDERLRRDDDGDRAETEWSDNPRAARLPASATPAMTSTMTDTAASDQGDR
jgi:hypothetical protein